MNDDSPLDDLQYIQYTLSLSPKLKERLDNHLQRLKYLQQPHSIRQFWLLHAVQEKLRKEENSIEPPKTKHLNLTLEQEIIDQLNAWLAQSPKTLTKKKWILDAIEERLEEEKNLIQTKQQPKKSQSTSKKQLVSMVEE